MSGDRELEARSKAVQWCRTRPEQTQHADDVADAERFVFVLRGLQRDVITEPLGLFVRIGVAAHVDQQRRVVDGRPFDFVETRLLAQSKGDEALTQDVLHGLAEAQVDAEGQRRDELGQPDGCNLRGIPHRRESTRDAHRRGRKMRRMPHDAGRPNSYVDHVPSHQRSAGTSKEEAMSKATKETTPITMDFEIAEDRACQLEGYTVNFVTIRLDHDLAPMLAALPGGMCHCPHWGVVTKGRMTVQLSGSRRGDRSWRRVLHAAGTHARRRSRHGVHHVQPLRPPRRDRGSDRQGNAADRTLITGRRMPGCSS